MSTTVSRRTAEVLLLPGDAAARVDEAGAAFSDALSKPQPKSGRFADTPIGPTDEAKAAAEEHDELARAAEDGALRITVQALRWQTYRRLLSEHPPRPDDDLDKRAQFNRETFPEALVLYWNLETGERTIIEPIYGGRDEMLAEVGELSAGYFDQLWTAVSEVNEGRSPDPKASAMSMLEQMYAARSAQRDTTD